MERRAQRNGDFCFVHIIRDQFAGKRFRGDKQSREGGAARYTEGERGTPKVQKLLEICII